MAKDAESAEKARKARLSQEDVPGYSLEQALRVVQAIADNHAYKPTRPMAVAEAMGVTPTSGGFRGVTGAAVAYGITTGGYNAAEIGLTPVGLRIVRPTSEGDDLAAKREALLKPRIVGDFLRHYDGAALPNDTIAKNVLAERGVPEGRLDAVLSLIVEGATSVGFIREWSGKRYVDLTGAAPPKASSDEEPAASAVAPTSTAQGPATRPTVSLSSGVNINIEIHIAADANTETIQEIFRSMQRYVLQPEASADEE